MTQNLTKNNSTNVNRRATNARNLNARNAANDNNEQQSEQLVPPNCPGQLRSLFLTDDKEQDFKPPFEKPEELTDIFFSLEEQNLELIQQQQEIEQAIENKFKDYQALRKRKREELLMQEQREAEVN